MGLTLFICVCLLQSTLGFYSNYHKSLPRHKRAVIAFSSTDSHEDNIRRLNYQLGSESDSVSPLLRSPESTAKEESNESLRVFESLVSYPCVFKIKVIGIKEGQFSKDMIDIVSRVVGVASEKINFTYRITKGKKYQSITIDAPVKSAKELYLCYEELSKDPRVKFKF